MDLERFFRQALQRGGNEPKLVGILSWLVVRLSGLLLLGLALFHLMYMHFIAPGGVAHQNYQAIAARWTDPAWGFTWRLLDLLLLGLALTHGFIGLGKIATVPLVRGVLLLAWLALLALGTWIIFSFRG